MANVDNPFGLSPIGTVLGAPYTGKTKRCVILAADATATFVGDTVKIGGTATADGKTPSVIQGTAGAQIYGVIESFDYDPDNLTRTYRPASTEIFCNVIIDPNVMYSVQEDSVGAALAVTAIGLNANLIYGAGNTTTGRSGVELDSSSAAATATLDVQIMEFLDVSDNAVGNNARLVVKINNHRFGSHTGTAGA